MAIGAMPDKEPRILANRIREHRENMQRVIDGIAAAVADDVAGDVAVDAADDRSGSSG
jgi:hypothetical protein